MATLEAGGLLAFGISERDHGSDLLANDSPSRRRAARVATATATATAMRRAMATAHGDGDGRAGRTASSSPPGEVLHRQRQRRVDRRDPRNSTTAPAPVRPGCAATRPAALRLRLNGCAGGGVPGARKIRTLGIRAASWASSRSPITQCPADIIADGRDAWDAVFGAVTLGRFFLGIGSVGICEHAMAEATIAPRRRVLYRQPAIALPHIRSAMARAYARLCAMKLYAYRALDYVHAATDDDRRYLLFTAVQKAKVSTDGVQGDVAHLRMRRRQRFRSRHLHRNGLARHPAHPGLEGSTHLNLKLAAQFANRYFARARAPRHRAAGFARSSRGSSLISAGDATPSENPTYVRAHRPVNTIDFPHFSRVSSLRAIPNVRLFLAPGRRRPPLHPPREVWQQRGGASAASRPRNHPSRRPMPRLHRLRQLIAEAATTSTAAPLVSAMFDLLIADLTAAALTLAALPQLGTIDRLLLRRAVAVRKPPPGTAIRCATDAAILRRVTSRGMAPRA
jgi:hypothetical protein